MPNIYKLITAKTLPKRTGDAHMDVMHAGNWPVSAEYAVVYEMKDKQFPEVQHEKITVFFDTYAEFEGWKAEKADWVRGTDNDFSVTYNTYYWDLGPNFATTEQI